MISTNKGHELDKQASDLLALINTSCKYYIFGAGLKGKELLTVLQTYGCRISFIDNDIKKIGKKIDGKEIISLDDYLERKDGKIIVAVSIKNTDIIIQQLEEHFLKYGKDFWPYEEFTNHIFPIISTYYYGKSYISLAQITLTERCSLKCKKCAHGCFAVDNTSRDLTLEQVYKSADCFFDKVDYVREFVLIGGEPLLYKDLALAIQYIGNKYRNHIGVYSITTNGTLIPKEDVLKACEKYKVLFRISNYSRQIPQLKIKHKKLIENLEKYNISYILGDEELEWMDYGFDYLDREATKDELIEVFDLCKTPCREIRENRFYYCVMARSVSENLGYYIGQDDYLDLDTLTKANYKKELLEFTLGYSQKGYLEMCNRCNGADAKKHPIPAAEQLIK